MLKSESNQPVLVLKIQLADEHYETLTLCETDIPKTVVQQFAETFSLTSKWQQVLLQEILTALNSMIEEQHAQKNAANARRRNTLTSEQKLKSEIQDRPNFHKKEPLSEHLTHLEHRRRQYIQQEKQMCPFAPQINKTSKALAKSRSTGYNQLYTDAATRNKRLKQQEEEVHSAFPFKPTINQTSVPQPEPVADRLYNARLNSEFRLQRKRSQLMQMVDPETGQEFFRPRIRHSPSVHKPREKIPAPVEAMPQVTLTPQTDRIYSNLKAKQYFQLFQLLGPNAAGYLCGNLLSTQQLDSDLLAIIQPLLDEIVDIQEGLTFEEFSDALDTLVRTLTPTERQIVLKSRRIATPVQAHQKKYQKNTHKVRRSDIFERNTGKVACVQQRLEKERGLLAETEFKDCTFKPVTTPYPPVKQSPNTRHIYTE